MRSGWIFVVCRRYNHFVSALFEWAVRAARARRAAWEDFAVSLHLEPQARETPARPAGSHLSEKVRSLRISESETARSRGRGGWLAWLLCAVLAVFTGFLALQVFNLQAERDAAAASAASAQTPLAGGSSEPAFADSGAVAHEAKGYVIPAVKVLISPKVSGMVRYLRVRKPGEDPQQGVPLVEGMLVQKGDILADLETTDYEADVLHARATMMRAEQRLQMELKNVPREIERAQAELNEATTLRDYAKAAFERLAKLRKTSAVSPADFDKAQSDYTSAQHRVERLERAVELIAEPRLERIKVAEADVKLAQAELTKAEWRLGNCTIVAPVTGTILSKKAEEGNVVNAIAFSGSTSVCEMADLGDLEIELDIQERDVSKIYVGQKCVVRAEAFPDHPYDGQVARLMPIANRAKGAIPVRVKVTIPAGEEGLYLKPEMGAVVAFYKPERASADSPANP
jgi:multidrug resistance efflux pump